MAGKLNTLNRLVTYVNTSPAPLPLRQFALSMLFNSQVKMAFTCGIKINELTSERATVQLKNRLRVQNHIGGVHACGMALLAESATGIVFGMNVPDTCIPLIKSMNIKYTKRAKGDLQAVASLTPQQVCLNHIFSMILYILTKDDVIKIIDIQSKDKGEVLVDVKVTDSSGQSPIECEMLWAWVSKQKK
jgi:acyl-coenzyme A thioesterase PaaI-like protein